jgi:hypothetical protein
VPSRDTGVLSTRGMACSWHVLERLGVVLRIAPELSSRSCPDSCFQVYRVGVSLLVSGACFGFRGF